MYCHVNSPVNPQTAIPSVKNTKIASSTEFSFTPFTPFHSLLYFDCAWQYFPTSLGKCDIYIYDSNSVRLHNYHWKKKQQQCLHFVGENQMSLRSAAVCANRKSAKVPFALNATSAMQFTYSNSYHADMHIHTHKWRRKHMHLQAGSTGGYLSALKSNFVLSTPATHTHTHTSRRRVMDNHTPNVVVNFIIAH